MKLSEELLTGEKKLGVWGIGFIGFSSMAYFASKGVQCIGTDVDPDKIKLVNKGEIAIPNMEFWLGFDTKPLAKAGLIKATLNWKELLDGTVGVHLICIPTEKEGKPYNDILVDVINKITKIKKTDEPALVIIESTLTPGTTDNVIIPILQKGGLKVGEDILVGVAPRRDWFISPEKNLKTLPRVVGGTTPETTKIMKEVLEIVCDTVLPAPDHRHAELVKSIENAYRHVEITLANQLSLAFPHINMREVLRLVGTKWNIGTYHPSFGTGGYCIPLSSQYVLMGAEHPEKLTILNATIETDMKQPYLVAESIIKRGSKKVGILGLAYKGDLKVCVLSPTIKIAEKLMENGIVVKIHDPYYTKEEIKKFSGADTFKFPEELGEFDTILITSGHRLYSFIPKEKILENLKNCKLIIDNVGIWKDINFGKIKYYMVGEKNWLNEF